MKIGAYQFKVTKNISENLEIIKKAIRQASGEKMKLMVFPECALTGYPPHDIVNSAVVDFAMLPAAYAEVQKLADSYDMYIIVGTITAEDNRYYNTAILFSAGRPMQLYHKRALWGWDKENFTPGWEGGVFQIAGWKVGIRICYEIRFPELFRELYREQTDLNVVLFYDTSDFDDQEKYTLIQSYLQVRADENVCYLLAVNTIGPYQNALTALYDKSGRILCAIQRDAEGLLMYELEKSKLSFGEKGRKEISDRFLIKKEKGLKK